MFDECSYRPHQLMYWPTTPSNGEFIFKEVDKEWLNPDLFLAAYPNWRDCTLLPTSSRESSVYKPTNRKQENPPEKKGLIGAFCRAYGIEEAIEKFIPDVYEPSIVDGDMIISQLILVLELLFMIISFYSLIMQVIPPVINY